MNCLEFRRLLTGEPRQNDNAVRVHRAECATCDAYARSMTDFDALIHEALAVPVPDEMRLTAGEPGRVRTPRVRWLALAASVLVAVGAGFVFWQAATPHSLHEAIVAHVYHEPDLLLLNASDRADETTVRTVLQRSQVSLTRDIGPVSHAGLCYFRGNLVAHLVVYSVNGPVTVLLLPDEQVDKAMPIHEDGFHGTIMPLDKGAIAVVGTDEADVHPVQSIISNAVEWQI